MNTKLLYLLFPLAFSMSLASMPHKRYKRSNQHKLNELFIKAASQGSIDLMTELLSKGVQVNAVFSSKHSTALHEAAEHGHTDCVKALIKAKADVNARNYIDASPLYLAAAKGQHACAKSLLEAKADVNARTDVGVTALHEASYRGHIDCLKALIDANADVNAQENTFKVTPLHLAASYGHTDCVKALIEAKADIDMLDEQHSTALHAAVKYGHTDCVKALAKSSHWLLPSPEAVSNSRARIFNALLQFVWLRNHHPELDNLKAESLQFEILSKNKLLQEDLVIILLDELRKGNEIKGVALIRSKDAAVSYLLKKLHEICSKIDADNVKSSLYHNLRKWFHKIFLNEENFGAIVKEGLDQRIEHLKGTGRNSPAKSSNANSGNKRPKPVIDPPVPRKKHSRSQKINPEKLTNSWNWKKIFAVGIVGAGTYLFYKYNTSKQVHKDTSLRVPKNANGHLA